MNLSLEVIHKYFNKFYLLHNPEVNIGFSNFIQRCCNVPWNLLWESPSMTAWGNRSFRSELQVRSVWGPGKEARLQPARQVHEVMSDMQGFHLFLSAAACSPHVCWTHTFWMGEVLSTVPVRMVSPLRGIHSWSHTWERKNKSQTSLNSWRLLQLLCETKSGWRSEFQNSPVKFPHM